MELTFERVKELIEESITYKNGDPFYQDHQVNGDLIEYHRPYYRLMTLLMQESDGIGVELGVHRGMGSYSLCLAGKPVIGVDHTKHPDLHKVIDRFPNFMFLERGSNPPPGEVTSQGQCISVLHIDTEHSYSMVDCEFNVYKPFFKKNAVVLFDDIHAADDDVLKFFNTLNFPKIHDDRLHSPEGFGVLFFGDRQ